MLSINNLRHWLLIFLSTTLCPILGSAQYTLDKEVSFVYLNGTSTLHDWTVTVLDINGTLDAEIVKNHILELTSASITIPVVSFNSGKEGMDKVMHKALKAEEFPNIKYRLKSYTLYNGTLNVKGTLTIAGVSKDVETKISQEGVGEHIKIRGAVELKMTDFNVAPPEFLLGAFKTGDDISISFYFMFCDSVNSYSDK